MPTIGTQPTLQDTQLVGASLLHQFARDRFIEAGISEELIREAEERENLDCLVAGTIHGNGDGSDGADTDASVNNTSTADTNYINDTSSFSKVSTTTMNNDSHAEQNVTANSFNNNQTARNDMSSEQYHSMAESVNFNDNTVYHSINHGEGAESDARSSAVNLERLQSSPAMKYYGRQLRLLAEEFEKDRKRLIVKDHANKVELKDISRENFVRLLEELFRDRITREKIVVLFFFCTDVALRAASFASELVVKLMGWSFSYIINTVCRVVHELGGWDHLLFRQLPSVLLTCCAALGICALSIYLRKSLRAS